MDAEVRRAVMDRDQVCVLSFLEPGHECRNVWGETHPPDEQLTYEHVKPYLAMGLRKGDDPRWGVALCWAGNVRPPTKAQRTLFREYLARVAT